MLISSFGSALRQSTNIATYVKANREAQDARQKEGQPRQEAELRSRLTL
jgi:hypothetical protein